MASVRETHSSKNEYRQEVLEACHNYDERVLRDKMKEKISAQKYSQKGTVGSYTFLDFFLARSESISPRASRCSL